MDCFAIHLFFFISNHREAEKGCREQVPCWGLGIGVTRPLCGIQRDGNRKSQGALARSRSGRVCRRQRTAPPCEFPGSKPHHSPSMDCIAIHPSPTFFKPPRSEDGSLRDNRPSGGGWGGSPITPPSSPRPSLPSLDAYLSPFHHRRTRSARKRIKLPVRHVLDSVVRLHRTRRRRSRRRYAVAMRRRHAPA